MQNVPPAGDTDEILVDNLIYLVKNASVGA